MIPMKSTLRNAKLCFSLLLGGRFVDLTWNTLPRKLVSDGNLPVATLW